MASTNNNAPPSNISADTIVEVKLANGRLRVPAGLVWRVPSLRPAIIEASQAKTGEAVAMPADVPEFLVPKKRAAIKVETKMSTRQWAELIDYLAYGGNLTEIAAVACLRNGVEVSAQMLEFLSLHAGTIVEKSGVPAHLTALAASDGFRRTLVEHGATATVTSTNNQDELPLSKGADGRSVPHRFSWPLFRSSDGFSWPCVKVLLPALPAGLKWRPDVVERLLVSASIQVGGNPVFSTTGAANKMVAQTFGVWPERTNSYGSSNAYMRSSKPWLVAIPIVSNETIPSRTTPFFPLLCTQYHEVIFLVSMETNLAALVEGPVQTDDIEPLRLAFEVDGILIDTPERRHLGSKNEYKRIVETPTCGPQDAKTESAPLPLPRVEWSADGDQKPSSDGAKVSVLSVPTAAGNVVPAGVGRSVVFEPTTVEEAVPASGTINLNLYGWVTGFILRLAPVDAAKKMPSSACPLLSATLMINGFMGHAFDVVDLVELNWKKVGHAKPQDEGVLLMPFGHRAMEMDSGDHINFSKIDKAQLRLTFQPQFEPADWKINLVTLGQNVGLVNGGMYGLRYAH
ncbi:hypothetical protein [Medusavirus stheno T3]|uniref:Uncharacterized protein n=1 Tax=Medusavirus stheno T3 TaxID=3069717 RepID=A0A7S7YEM1_9VIRU|nr:hypothetical protein QKU73_gp403 [Acanthamoeba castellanii medusavirus]QPB44372.1 hypothetical protein [Medusavirus stheno T3]